MKKIFLSIVLVFVMATCGYAQTITPTGINQGDLVALLQNIVDALGSTVGSTYLTAGSAIAIAAGALTATSLKMPSASSTRLGQVLETNASETYGGASFNTWSTANNNAPLLDMCKSGATTPGSHTIVADDENLGFITFRGSDGTDFNDAALIAALVDGTPGAGTDMPGRLEFRTSPDGSATATTSVIVNSSQNTTLGATDLALDDLKLYVDGDAKANTFVSKVYDWETQAATGPSAPDTGEILIFWAQKNDTKWVQVLMESDGSTVEVYLEP